VAAGASSLYWAGFPAGNGTVWAAGLDGTLPHSILGAQSPNGVAAGASHLYWTDGTTINEANPDGTSPHPIVTGQDLPCGVAVGSWTRPGCEPPRAPGCTRMSGS
jgi:hypothetical protein